MILIQRLDIEFPTTTLHRPQFVAELVRFSEQDNMEVSLLANARNEAFGVSS